LIIHKPSVYGGGHQTPKLVIVHSMAEYIRDGKKVYPAFEWLEYLRLSAHALITPEGDVIRMRQDDEIAWHARGFNTGSLGVEFLVPGTHDYGSFLKSIDTPWTTDNQVEAGLDLVRLWQSLHNIKEVKRHSDVSPGRKVDPGHGFPWEVFER